MTESAVSGGMSALLGFDPLDPGFRLDPYPHYARLREEQPIFRSPLGFWMVTRHRDCSLLLQDPRFGYPEGDAAKATDLFAAGFSSQRDFFIFMNPPDHTRMRDIVRAWLSPRVVRSLRPYVQAAADRLLDEALRREEFDLIGSFAHALPFGVICELLDVPGDDRPMIMKLAQDYLAGIGPAVSVTPEQHQARDEAVAALNDYFRALSARRRAVPGSDVLTHLTQALDGGSMSEDELLGTCILLFVAGHGTTTNLIGNSTLALLRHPEQRARFLAEPKLEGSAIEELLRYDAPTQMSFRVALEDVPLDDGHVVAAGEQVLAVRGAANRDPAVHADPDRLDLGRTDNRHLTFGGGIHVCLGSALGRMQARTALRTLLQRAPALALAGRDLEYQESLMVRGLKALHVSTGPGAVVETER
ncbi:cytochrome P450 [Actinomadura viridis]|uniref:cytochrome P450 n=1 Tax=Actinomadura viridis TaxID=58110 RepID=UPI0036A635F2